ncbi:putative membrane protein [Chitinophaga dinghuensis]|uniref:Putative membrane protein n=2 Tax=Chitinophaga dinghuensis TaxID=1539050 RepID=A0A327W0S9_9BACT|nr:putative membrane protein [Chitinophaga dinghuensis]
MIILIITVCFTGLMAGLFYSWSVSVIPGLAKLNDEQFLAAFQAMNRAILNPLFLCVFTGNILLLAIATWQQFHHEGYRYMMLTSALYMIGVFGITAFGNVPLNDTLDKFDLVNASKDAIKDMRMDFEGLWVKLHTIRTIAAVLAFICGLIGLYQAANEN